jgi:hypothetical protein
LNGDKLDPIIKHNSLHLLTSLQTKTLSYVLGNYDLELGGNSHGAHSVSYRYGQRMSLKVSIGISVVKTMMRRVTPIINWGHAKIRLQGLLEKGTEPARPVLLGCKFTNQT